MAHPNTWVRSSIGRKFLMAATGALLVLFVIGHMIGNLQIYQGPAALNAYAEWLRDLGHGAALWTARLVLLAAVVVHVVAAVSLARENQAARPVPYYRLVPSASTYASRTLLWSGPILALFIVYHVLHFTTGQAHPAFDPGDVYHNVIVGFRTPWVSGFYVLSMLALGLHLHHGVWSMTQSFGWSHPRIDALRRQLALGVTVLVVAGNVSIPVSVLIGWVR